MFYNVENLFDIHDDPLTDDEEFTPGSARHWTWSRYQAKLNSLFKIIIAAGEWSLPAIVGLCEVENRQVLRALVDDTNLNRFEWGIVHEDSPDPRGIDVCLIYRKAIVTVIDYDYMIPGMLKERFLSRPVLYVKCRILADTIHLFLNHWPSRRGGALEGEPLRLILARMIRSRTDSIFKLSRGDARIIIAGDFNSLPGEKSIRILTGNTIGGPVMVNLSALLPKGSGTYRYRGNWEIIDQVIVSETLLKSDKGLFTRPEMLTIFKPGFLMTSDRNYPGEGPFRTYSGYRYTGGYSDHLPVLLDLRIR
jgi:hypothetical protein